MESRIKRIVLPPTRCPSCHVEAVCTHTLTLDPPIYVYSCGCRIQYETSNRTQPLDVPGKGRNRINQRDRVKEMERWAALYHAINQMMARLGEEGEITAKDSMADGVMDALHDIDGGVYNPSIKVHGGWQPIETPRTDGSIATG